MKYIHSNLLSIEGDFFLIEHFHRIKTNMLYKFGGNRFHHNEINLSESFYNCISIPDIYSYNFNKDSNILILPNQEYNIYHKDYKEIVFKSYGRFRYNKNWHLIKPRQDLSLCIENNMDNDLMIFIEKND